MQLGDILLGTSDEVLITWWGPDPIPEGHILMESVNSIVCQPSEDDTCISNMNCTGWIRLMLGMHPNIVADMYSVSGECITVYVCVYMCMRVHVHVCVRACVYRGEGV